jgi:hypothetical protein
MAQPLDAGRHPGWALGGVDADRRSAGVVHQRLLHGCLGQGVHAGDHPDRGAARIGEVDGQPADHLGQCPRDGAGLVGHPQHIDLVGGLQREADEPGVRAVAQQHAGRAGVGAAQVELGGGAQRGLESEGPGERLGAGQVGLLELQPGQSLNFDDRVAGPPGVFAGSCAVLAV